MSEDIVERVCRAATRVTPIQAFGAAIVAGPPIAISAIVAWFAGPLAVIMVWAVLLATVGLIALAINLIFD